MNGQKYFGLCCCLNFILLKMYVVTSLTCLLLKPKSTHSTCEPFQSVSITLTFLIGIKPCQKERENRERDSERVSERDIGREIKQTEAEEKYDQHLNEIFAFLSLLPAAVVCVLSETLALVDLRTLPCSLMSPCG